MGQMRFGPRSCVAAVMMTLLLTAANLSAGPTVSWVSGGPNNGLPVPGAGYVNGDITSEAEYNTPCGLTFDSTGNFLYVADRDNNAVRVLQFDIENTRTLQTYSNQNLVTSLFSKPVGVALDKTHNVLFVLNRGNGTNGSVLQFQLQIDGTADLIATNLSKVTNAGGIAVDTLDNIYVTASNQVFKVVPSGVSNVVATITASGASLQGIVVKRSGPTAGLLAVCDTGRNGILFVNPITGNVTTNAGFHGAGDFTTTDNISSSNNAHFFQPTGVGEAGDGTLIVSDYGNHRVKVVLANGVVTNLYGVTNSDWVTPSLGYPGFTDLDNGVVHVPDQPGGVSARLPNGVVLAPDGSVYVTEDYYHIIRHVTGAGLQSPLPWPPPLPADLTATAGYGRVILAWTESSGATNYNVKRSTTSGVPYTNNIVGSVTTNGYTDTNVINGTTYYYVVSASNAGGESTNSSEVSATPLPSPAPTILNVTTNYGQVTLTWSTSAGATSYNVKRSPSSGGSYTTIATNITSTSYTDTGVSNGTTYYYVVSAVNTGGEGPNSSEVSATPPIPPPLPPRIGWFDYEGPIGEQTTVLHPVSGANYYTAYNELFIAIDPIVDGIHTYYTMDSSVPSSTNGSAPPHYQDGLVFAQHLSVPAVPDLVIKAVNVGPGGSSAIVTAEFLFQVGNPTIIGANAAHFTVSDITTNVTLWYTTDGTDPTNASPSIGPIVIANGNPVTLSINVSSNILFQARAFRDGYYPSGIGQQSFSPTNFVPNTISFGFASGEASSDFVASPGQYFYAPVTLNVLPDQTIYSLQFNVTVTNVGSAPLITPGAFNFESMLMKPIPGVTPVVYESIPPAMFVSTNPVPNWIKFDGSTNFSSLLFTNTSLNLLGVGWLERAGKTNLYDTTTQDLITYSQAHDITHLSKDGLVEVGGYAFWVPITATNGQTYQIQIGRPSATSDGIGAPGSSVFIYAPTNGSPGGGTVNSIKTVTMGQRKYIVGNVYPFRWFNAGDFGNTNLQNADVMQVFESAIYKLNTPPPDSDFFDAMDSCGNIGVDNGSGIYTNTAIYPILFTYSITNYTFNYDAATNLIDATSNILSLIAPIYIYTTSILEVSTNTSTYPTATNVALVTTPYYPPSNPYWPNLFDGDDQNINQIVFGDGVLDVCDVYVTYRRSLDPSLIWYRRFWTNGFRVADTTSNFFNPNVVSMSSLVVSKMARPAISFSATNQPKVDFAGGDCIASAGQTVSIPITANIFGDYPLRVLMLNLTVVPLDGSPALTTPATFSANSALGTPWTTDHQGNGNYSAVWLDSTISGLTGNATLGTLTVAIPTNATSSSAYAIHFDHASASPNGLASFPKQTLTGLITLSNRSSSYYNDGIPDSWRLRYFGTIYNLLSVSNACPTGDGINNWLKYVAGVDPNTPDDFPSLNSTTPAPVGATVAIHWPSVAGKQYVILRSSSLFNGSWTAIATNTGTGTDMEFDDAANGTVYFYRVQILP